MTSLNIKTSNKPQFNLLDIFYNILNNSSVIANINIQTKIKENDKSKKRFKNIKKFALTSKI